MPAGRPSVLTPALKKQIPELLLYGFSDFEIAVMIGSSERTIRRVRCGQLWPDIQKTQFYMKLRMLKQITHGKRPDWPRYAWFLERRFPKEFAKPEIQLAVQNNYSVSQLSISIGKDEVKEIEAQANPVRESVKEMYAKYRPTLGNGNGHDDNSTG